MSNINSRNPLGNSIFGSGTFSVETVDTNNILNNETSTILLNAKSSGTIGVHDSDELHTNTIKPYSGSTVSITGATLIGTVVLPDTIAVNTINEKTLNGDLVIQSTGLGNVKIENTTFKHDIIDNVNDLSITTSGTTKNIILNPTGIVSVQKGLDLTSISAGTIDTAKILGLDSSNHVVTQRAALANVTSTATYIPFGHASGYLTETSNLTYNTSTLSVGSFSINGSNNALVASSGDITLKATSGDVLVEESLKVYDTSVATKFIDMHYDSVNDLGFIQMHDSTHLLKLCGGADQATEATVGITSGSYPTYPNTIFLNGASVSIENSPGTKNIAEFTNTDITLKKTTKVDSIAENTLNNGTTIGTNTNIKSTVITTSAISAGVIANNSSFLCQNSSNELIKTGICLANIVATSNYIPYGISSVLGESSNLQFNGTSFGVNSNATTTNSIANILATGLLTTGAVSLNLGKDSTDKIQLLYNYDTTAVTGQKYGAIGNKGNTSNIKIYDADSVLYPNEITIDAPIVNITEEFRIIDRTNPLNMGIITYDNSTSSLKIISYNGGGMYATPVILYTGCKTDNIMESTLNNGLVLNTNTTIKSNVITTTAISTGTIANSSSFLCQNSSNELIKTGIALTNIPCTSNNVPYGISSVLDESNRLQFNETSLGINSNATTTNSIANIYATGLLTTGAVSLNLGKDSTDKLQFIYNFDTTAVTGQKYGAFCNKGNTSNIKIYDADSIVYPNEIWINAPKTTIKEEVDILDTANDGIGIISWNNTTHSLNINSYCLSGAYSTNVEIYTGVKTDTINEMTANNGVVLNTNTNIKSNVITTTAISAGTVASSSSFLAQNSSNEIIKSSITAALSGVLSSNIYYIPYSNGTNLVESGNFQFDGNLKVYNVALDMSSPITFSLGRNATYLSETVYTYSNGANTSTSSHKINGHTYLRALDDDTGNEMECMLDKNRFSGTIASETTSTLIGLNASGYMVKTGISEATATGTTLANVCNFSSTTNYNYSGSTSYIYNKAYGPSLGNSTGITQRIGVDDTESCYMGYVNMTTAASRYSFIQHHSATGNNSYLELHPYHSAISTELVIPDLSFSALPAEDTGQDLVVLTSAGTYGFQVRRKTSSKRYKDIIGQSNFDFYSNIDKLKLTKYIYKKSTTKEIQVGLIAEDIDEIPAWQECVILDDKGKPDGIHFEELTCGLIDCVQKQKAEIEKLKKQIKSMCVEQQPLKDVSQDSVILKDIETKVELLSRFTINKDASKVKLKQKKYYDELKKFYLKKNNSLTL